MRERVYANQWAEGAAPTGNEPSQPAHDASNTTQTDRETIAVRKAQAGASDERSETPKPASETEPPAKRAKEHPLGAAVAASEAGVPVEAEAEALKEQPEAKPEAQTGEKRDHDSTATPTPAAVTEAKDKDNEKPDEPDTKKQKTESESTKQSAQDPADPTPPASAEAAAGKGPKKAALPKKEKVKDAVKVTPTEGISSRTRSRTKPT